MIRMLKKKRVLVFLVLIVFFGIYLGINVKADCACNPECSAGQIEYGGNCGDCGSTMQRDCSGTCTWDGWYCQNNAPSNYGQSCGSCGGTIQCDSSCSIPNCRPTATISQSKATTVPGESFTISWGSTNADSCTVEYDYSGDNLGWIFLASGTSGSRPVAPTQTGTFDVRNTCTGAGGTAQASIIHTVTAAGAEICDSIDNNANSQIDEGCDDDNDNYCDSGMAISGTPTTCTNGGNDCNDANANINPGRAEICTDGIDNDCDGFIDWADSNCQAATEISCTDGIDNDGDGRIDCADTDCAGQTGPGGALCCQTAANCLQSACKIESCVSNTCQYSNRNACATTECIAGTYCDSAGGTCRSPENSNYVCSNCVADQTSGLPWSPSNHQDAGKAYSTNADVFTALFNSNAGPCSPASGGSCYDSNGNPVNHKSSLSSGSCCGDDANEFYKPDYYAGECTNDVNDCVWSTGDSQSSNTGNAQWWCYLHEWNECNSAKICAKVGGVTCNGTAWISNSQLLPENQCTDGIDNDCDGFIDWADSNCQAATETSCTDGIDNDGDSLIDCQDPDCAGSISGNVKNTDGDNINGARIDALQGAALKYTEFTDSLGNYQANGVLCGAYNMVASASGYISSTITGVNLPPKGSITADFTGEKALVEGGICETDCTYTGDDIVHKECDMANGCNFYDAQAALVCDLAQPGWIRDYSQTQQIQCAEGAPYDKIEVSPTVTCEKENLIESTQIVNYQGKLVRMIVVTCG